MARRRTCCACGIARLCPSFGEGPTGEATARKLVQPGPAQDRGAAAQALAEAAAGRIRPVIGQTFSLEQAAGAHAAIEARSTVGKTLLLA